MKILYLLEATSAGVSLKVSQQLKYWEKCGHHVTLTRLNKKTFFSIISWVLTNFSKDKFDIVYSRETPFAYVICCATYLVSAKTSFFIELNTRLADEFTLKGKWIALYVYKLVRLLTKILPVYFIGVTREICLQKFLGSSTCYVIPNSFEPQKLNCLSTFGSLPDSSDSLQGAFVIAKNYEYSGSEHLLPLSKIQSNMKIHVVGITKEEFCSCYGYQNLNNEQLIFHGFLSIPEVNDVLSECSFGIASLSLYKKKLTEACDLKSRLYMSMGLKIISGYIDSAFFDGSKYILSLNSEPNMIAQNIDNIYQFLSEPFSKHDAIEHYQKRCSLQTIEKRRLDIFRSQLAQAK